MEGMANPANQPISKFEFRFGQMTSFEVVKNSPFEVVKNSP